MSVMRRLPKCVANYDYGTYDPEDVIYGDFQRTERNLREVSGRYIGVTYTEAEGTEDVRNQEGELRNASAGEMVDSRGTLGSPDATSDANGSMSHHRLSSSGICQRCGCSREAIRHFGWDCNPVIAMESGPDMALPPIEREVQNLYDALGYREREIAQLAQEAARLREILMRIVRRYERESPHAASREHALMLAWAMHSDAREGL
jgi:hypothetical protein